MELNLGDIVSLGWDDGYATCTVCQVYNDGYVDLFRPYTHTEDFSCSGSEPGSISVICYIGVETVKHVKPQSLKLLKKAQLLK